MIALITDAIHRRSKLRFLYEDKWREVEPHAYGRTSKGTDAILAWQLSGGSGEDFRFFLYDKLTDLNEGLSYITPRDSFRRGDKRFVHIYAEV